MKKAVLGFVVVSALTFLTVATQASAPEAPPPGGGPREACRADAQKFCGGIQPGGGRIKDCLEDHYKEISDACYTALKNSPPGPPPNDPNGAPPRE